MDLSLGAKTEGRSGIACILRSAGRIGNQQAGKLSQELGNQVIFASDLGFQQGDPLGLRVVLTSSTASTCQRRDTGIKQLFLPKVDLTGLNLVLVGKV